MSTTLVLWFYLSKFTAHCCNGDMGKGGGGNGSVPMFLSCRDIRNISYLHLQFSFFFCGYNPFAFRDNKKLITVVNVPLVSCSLSKMNNGNVKVLAFCLREYCLPRYLPAREQRSIYYFLWKLGQMKEFHSAAGHGFEP